jgi:hypothetical protein
LPWLVNVLAHCKPRKQLGSPVGLEAAAEVPTPLAGNFFANRFLQHHSLPGPGRLRQPNHGFCFFSSSSAAEAAFLLNGRTALWALASRSSSRKPQLPPSSSPSSSKGRLLCTSSWPVPAARLSFLPPTRGSLRRVLFKAPPRRLGRNHESSRRYRQTSGLETRLEYITLPSAISPLAPRGKDSRTSSATSARSTTSRSLTRAPPDGSASAGGTTSKRHGRASTEDTLTDASSLLRTGTGPSPSRSRNP